MASRKTNVSFTPQVEEKLLRIRTKLGGHFGPAEVSRTLAHLIDEYAERELGPTERPTVNEHPKARTKRPAD